MYWQVYLHKTSLVAEQLLIRALQRAKELLAKGQKVRCSENLMFFLNHKIAKPDFDSAVLNRFAMLDDTDLLAAIKQWRLHSDRVLSSLCEMLLDRKLLNIKLKNKPITAEKLKVKFDSLKKHGSYSNEECAYFVFTGSVHHKAYEADAQNINILKGNGKLVDVAKASDHLNLRALSKKVTKYYICYPKDSR